VYPAPLVAVIRVGVDLNRRVKIVHDAPAARDESRMGKLSNAHHGRARVSCPAEQHLRILIGSSVAPLKGVEEQELPTLGVAQDLLQVGQADERYTEPAIDAVCPIQDVIVGLLARRVDCSLPESVHDREAKSGFAGTFWGDE
jgi:hypothetical protein